MTSLLLRRPARLCINTVAGAERILPPPLIPLFIFYTTHFQTDYKMTSDNNSNKFDEITPAPAAEVGPDQTGLQNSSEYQSTLHWVPRYNKSGWFDSYHSAHGCISAKPKLNAEQTRELLGRFKHAKKPWTDDDHKKRYLSSSLETVLMPSKQAASPYTAYALSDDSRFQITIKQDPHEWTYSTRHKLTDVPGWFDPPWSTDRKPRGGSGLGRGGG